MTRFFAPRLLLGHLLALAALGICLWLGSWQYDTWQAARANAGEDTSRRTPIPLDDALGPDAPFANNRVGQPVLVEGTWLPDSTMLVAGRSEGEDRGYWVVSVIGIADSGSGLLIIRGFTETPDTVPPEPTGSASFVGWLEPPEGDPSVVDDDPDDRVIPQLRIADALQLVDRDLYGGFAFVADRGVGDHPYGSAAVNAGTTGLQPVTVDLVQEAGRWTALRNVLYAAEWWFFGGFVVLLWQRWVRDEWAQAADA